MTELQPTSFLDMARSYAQRGVTSPMEDLLQLAREEGHPVENLLEIQYLGYKTAINACLRTADSVADSANGSRDFECEDAIEDALAAAERLKELGDEMDEDALIGRIAIIRRKLFAGGKRRRSLTYFSHEEIIGLLTANIFPRFIWESERAVLQRETSLSALVVDAIPQIEEVWDWLFAKRHVDQDSSSSNWQEAELKARGRLMDFLYNSILYRKSKES